MEIKVEDKENLRIDKYLTLELEYSRSKIQKLIKDEKIAIMDTIDERRTEQWLQNLDKALDGRQPDYLVISHLEPDHAYNIETLLI